MITITGTQLGGGPSSLSLEDLSDVSIVSPQTGQYLRYNASISEWQNAFIAPDVYSYLTASLTSSNNIILTFTPSTNSINIGYLLTASAIDTALGYVPLNRAGDTMFGNLNMNGNYILNLATPINSTDGANKAYVDAAVSGLDVHSPAAAATTGDLGATYTAGTTDANGGLGIGARLSASGTLVVDGYVVNTNDRILVKNQTVQTQNGVYTLTSSTSPWILTRATDYNDSVANQVAPGNYIFVQNGSTQKSTGWIQTGTIPIIGTNNIVFIQFSAANSYSAGTGLSLIGTTFANAGVLSNTAGTGISISSPSGNNLITNTGVTSLIAGANISISSGTGAVTVSIVGTIPTATTATNFAGGASGEVLWQAGPNETSFTAAGTTGQLLQSNGSAAPSWLSQSAITVGTATNATNATNAVNVAVSATTTNAIFYPTFVSATTGNLPIDVSSRLTFNPNTGNLTSTTFTGALIGNATTATTVTSLNGGAANQIVYQTAANQSGFIAAPTTASTFLEWNGTAFTWAAATGTGGVTSFSAGTTGLTPATATTGAVVLAGTLAVTNGGTGLTTIATGEIPYGNGTGPLATSTALSFNGTSTLTVGSPSSSAGTLSSGTGQSLTINGTTFLTLGSGGTTAGTGVNVSLTTGTAAKLSITGPTAANYATSLQPNDIPNVQYVTTAITTGNSATSTLATNIAGGAANDIVYQTSVGTTGFITPGTNGFVLTMVSGVPSWASAGSATNATTVGTSNNTTSAATWYPTFVSAASGNNSITVDNAVLTFVPSTGTLSTTVFSGALNGNAATSTTATNIAGGSLGSIPYQSATGTTSMLAPGASTYILQSNGAAAPSWINPATSLTVNNSTNTTNIAVTAVTTNATFYPIFVSATSGNLASDVSTGLTYNPSTHSLSTTTFIGALSGNATTSTTATNIAGGVANQIPYQTGTNTTSFITAPTTASTFLEWNGSAFTWAAATGTGGVTSFSAGTTGLTPATATTGAITLAGTLGVPNGGTGLATVPTGEIPYGNGTSPLTTSVNLSFDGVSTLTIGAPSSSAGTLGSGAGQSLTVDGATFLTLVSGGSTAGNGINVSLNSGTSAKLSVIGPTAVNYATSLQPNDIPNVQYVTTASTTGNSATSTLAAAATTVAITATTTNATFHPTFVSGTSGNLPQDVASSLTFNPSTGVLAAVSFSGAGTGLTGTAASLSIGGNAATATTATTATNATLATDSNLIYVQPNSANTNYSVPFASTPGAAYANLYSSSGLVFNPSTLALSTSGSFISTASGVNLQFGGGAASGFYADGTNIAIRTTNQTGITYFQTASGTFTQATLDHSGNLITAGNITANGGTISALTFSGNATSATTAAQATEVYVQPTSAAALFPIPFVSANGPGYANTYTSTSFGYDPNNNVLTNAGPGDFTTVASGGFGLRIRQPSGSSAILQFVNSAGSAQLGALYHDGTNLILANNISGGPVVLSANSPSGQVLFQVNGVNAVEIDSAGQIDIGVNPGGVGEVWHSSINVATANNLGGTGYAGFLGVTNTTSGATNASKFFRINPSGGFEIINNAYTAVIASISDSGILSAVELNATSDITMKTDIVGINNGLGIIEELNGVRFNWKDTGKPSAGLIAQDVEKVMPELVQENMNGVKSLNYNGIIGALVEAVKELTARIKELESKNDQ